MALSAAICALDAAAIIVLMEPLTQTSLTLANSLPLTPGGLGVGEATFARACELLEPGRSGTAYATVFVA